MRKSIGFDYKYDSPPADRLRIIESAGFDSIYLHAQYQPHNYMDLVARSALRVESLHLSYKQVIDGRIVDPRHVNVLWQYDDAARQYVDQLVREVRFAHSYGIPIVVMHITGGSTPPPMNEAGVANIERVLEACEKYGIALCLENLRRLDYLDFAFSALRSDYLRFCFDSGHANYMTGNVYTFPWEKYGNKLSYLHLNDNDGMSDQHALPFAGVIDWQRLMPTIHRLNPNLSLTLEVRSSSDSRKLVSERDYVEACFRSVNRLQGVLEA